MVEFAYNNTKNINTGYTLFELNFGFYLRVFSKKDVNLHSRSKSADQLAIELQTLMSMYKKNL